jgi:IclR family acetate operon transcriptional repressor
LATTAKSGDGVRAVNRALEILLAFVPATPELTATELLKRVNLSRPTLYRLLKTLEHGGFVTSAGDPQRFRLGPSVAQLSHAWTAAQDLSTVAQSVLRSVWEQTGETVALFVPHGDERVCVAELPSAQPLSFRRGVGYREQLTRGASGRAILAHLGGGNEKELELVRERGYATSKDELIKGAVAIAAAFFDSAGQVAGSVAVFGPGVRFSDSRVKACGTLLVKAAKDISMALGLRPLP